MQASPCGFARMEAEGKNLIIKLSDTMNNERLSTNLNMNRPDETLNYELDLLVKSDPFIHIDNEGRAKVIAEKKIHKINLHYKSLFVKWFF